MTRRIFGLDFSGASDAGRKIWLAEGRASPDGLEILSCRTAAELPGGGVERDQALTALRHFIAETTDAVFGCDFPFSLPRALIQAPSWTEFIAGFAHDDAAAFRAHCRALTAGREPKRATDIESKTPWCAFNIRLYHQSFHGMAALLRPLVLESRAFVLPMQTPTGDRPWLVEVCPASTLAHLKMRRSYKGRGLADSRRQILAKLVERRLLRPLAADMAERVIDNPGGDALDSILTALAALQAWRKVLAGHGDGDRLEGRVYFRVAAKADPS